MGWKDDYGWKEYDLETMKQIEDAYQNKDKTVELSQGNFLVNNLKFILLNLIIYHYLLLHNNIIENHIMVDGSDVFLLNLNKMIINLDK